MPLTWAQVQPGLDPKTFTLRAAPGLFAASKAWDGYDGAARPLRAASEKLRTAWPAAPQPSLATAVGHWMT
jgi:bifunctional non-homologous end joining protein LigD